MRQPCPLDQTSANFYCEGLRSSNEDGLVVQVPFAGRKIFSAKCLVVWFFLSTFALTNDDRGVCR